jgi:hypothetical protein
MSDLQAKALQFFYELIENGDSDSLDAYKEVLLGKNPQELVDLLSNHLASFALSKVPLMRAASAANLMYILRELVSRNLGLTIEVIDVGVVEPTADDLYSE